MDSVIDILKTKSNLLNGTGASEQQIKDAEDALKIHFASDYKEYLCKYAIVAFEGRELTGITPSKWVDVVAVTKTERKRYPEERNSIYVIEKTNMDDVVYWQSEDGRIYRTYGIKSPELAYNSFSEYLSE